MITDSLHPNLITEIQVDRLNNPPTWVLSYFIRSYLRERRTRRKSFRWVDYRVVITHSFVQIFCVVPSASCSDSIQFARKLGVLSVFSRWQRDHFGVWKQIQIDVCPKKKSGWAGSTRFLTKKEEVPVTSLTYSNIETRMDRPRSVLGGVIRGVVGRSASGRSLVPEPPGATCLLSVAIHTDFLIKFRLDFFSIFLGWNCSVSTRFARESGIFGMFTECHKV